MHSVYFWVERSLTDFYLAVLKNPKFILSPPRATIEGKIPPNFPHVCLHSQINVLSTRYVYCTPRRIGVVVHKLREHKRHLARMRPLRVAAHDSSWVTACLPAQSNQCS